MKTTERQSRKGSSFMTGAGRIIGWLAGGYISHALAKILGVQKAGILGGLLGGLIPVTGFALWGFYMIMR